MLAVASLVVENSSSGSGSSPGSVTANSVLGCPLASTGVAHAGCTSRQSISRACDLPLIDVAYQVTSGGFETGNSVVWFGATPGDRKAAIVASATGDPNYAAVIMCPGSSTGWPLRSGMWSTLNHPGDPSVLPNWLR